MFDLEKVSKCVAQAMEDRLIETMQSSIFASDSNWNDQCASGKSIVDDILTAKKTIEEQVAYKPVKDYFTRLVMIPYPIKRKRTHRKKRIDKKWAKRYSYFVDRSVDDGNLFVINNGQLTMAYPGTYCKARRMTDENSVPVGEDS